MVAQRLSVLGALRQISSMNAKNRASRRGDWWAVSSSPHQAAAAAKRDAYRKEMEHTASPELPISTLAPFHPFLSSHPDMVGMEKKDSSQSTLADCITEKWIDWFMAFLKFKKQDCVIHIEKFCTPKASKTGMIYQFSLLFEEL